MYGKKQRIISFLMAFLLIFTFAFINPLTVSQSQAFVPAAILSAEGIKMIAGVVVSCGLGIAAGQTLQEVDYEGAVEAISSSIWSLLSIAEKIQLLTLSIVDNIVEIPIALYNSIKNKAELLYNTNNYAPTLAEQGVSIQYLPIYSNDLTQYPNLSFPIYDYDKTINTGSTTLDMSSASPYIVYNYDTPTETQEFNKEGLVENMFKVTEDYSTEEGSISSDFSFTNSLVVKTSEYYNFKYLKLIESTDFYNIQSRYINGTNEVGIDLFGQLYKTYNSIPLSNQIIKLYIIHDVSNRYYSLQQVFNKVTGEFLYQRYFDIGSFFYYNPYGITSTPLSADIVISPEIEVAPTVSVNDGADIVLTLPTELSSTIGLTSSDVNVGSIDVPETPNTETMENINTNVGELVTGGTLGEQVNTNIGTVEGLHNELTQSADFTGLMDVLAEYISFMDISAISWLTTAIPLVVAPFIPFVSLGMILLFIDRVLNGGA